MIKPTKEAFLKHDLYKIVRTHHGKAYELDKIPAQEIKKVASKGDRFVWCDTDRKDAAHGWFADAGNGKFVEGNCGFGKMYDDWAKEHLTEPTPLEGFEFKQHWDSHNVFGD